MIRQPILSASPLLRIFSDRQEEKTKSKTGEANLKLPGRLCVQMMHIGSFDSEPKFPKIEQFLIEQDCQGFPHTTRNLPSDPRKTAPENCAPYCAVKFIKDPKITLSYLEFDIWETLGSMKEITHPIMK
jgi:hypothetical protein